MTAFYDGSYDMLLSTNIVESGLDIPTANTMIIHRADMFGLAQLYQLRGRIGRAKLRGYAYLTTPPGKALTETAQRRLRGDADPRPARRRLHAWPATISTSAAPATCWATSSPAISARSASSSTSRCWRRRCARRAATREGSGAGLDAADQHRHAGADPGELCRRISTCASASIAASRTWRPSRRSTPSPPS